MEDVFYLSRRKILLENIAHVAEKAGYRYEYLHIQANVILKIFYSKAEQSFWQCETLSFDDLGGFEPEQIVKIQDSEAESFFMISFHVVSKEKLVALLKQLLLTFEGWIGIDDGSFETLYTVDNIDNLRSLY